MVALGAFFTAAVVHDVARSDTVAVAQAAPVKVTTVIPVGAATKAQAVNHCLRNLRGSLGIATMTVHYNSLYNTWSVQWRLNCYVTRTYY